MLPGKLPSLLASLIRLLICSESTLFGQSGKLGCFKSVIAYLYSSLFWTIISKVPVLWVFIF